MDDVDEVDEVDKARMVLVHVVHFVYVIHRSPYPLESWFFATCYRTIAGRIGGLK